MDDDHIAIGTAVGLLFVLIALPYMRGIFQAWREDQRQRATQPEFVFRTVANLGAGFAGGDNAWGGCLVTDRPMDAITCEILRAAVERYRARSPLPPCDGDHFRLVDGELVLL